MAMCGYWRCDTRVESDVYECLVVSALEKQGRSVVSEDALFFLSTHADRHVGGYIVYCLFFCLFVHRIFGNGYLGRGLR